jgi:hypothetical protein
MKRAVLKLFTWLLVFVALTACHRNPGAKMQAITGKPNEVVIVIGKEIWNGEIGGLMRNILSSPGSPLPANKPSFALIDVPPDAFINLFKSHRNIITVKISSSFTEPKVEYTHDTWACPQAVVNIQASSADNFKVLFTAHGEKIRTYFLKAENERLKKTANDIPIKPGNKTLDK